MSRFYNYELIPVADVSLWNLINLMILRDLYITNLQGLIEEELTGENIILLNQLNKFGINAVLRNRLQSWLPIEQERLARVHNSRPSSDVFSSLHKLYGKKVYSKLQLIKDGKEGDWVGYEVPYSLRWCWRVRAVRRGDQVRIPTCGLFRLRDSYGLYLQKTKLEAIWKDSGIKNVWFLERLGVGGGGVPAKPIPKDEGGLYQPITWKGTMEQLCRTDKLYVRFQLVVDR